MTTGRINQVATLPEEGISPESPNLRQRIQGYYAIYRQRASGAYNTEVMKLYQPNAEAPIDMLRFDLTKRLERVSNFTNAALVFPLNDSCVLKDTHSKMCSQRST